MNIDDYFEVVDTKRLSNLAAHDVVHDNHVVFLLLHCDAIHGKVAREESRSTRLHNMLLSRE